MAQHPHAGGLGTLLWYYQHTDSRVTISPTVEFTYNAHEDIMGSASYYTKQTGAVYEEHIYDAWGGVRWSTGHGVNDGKTLVIEPNYTGHSYDPILKIYHGEARFYDGKTRQWMGSDPIKSGLNWYQYVGANPTNYVDPTGLRYVETDGDITRKEHPDNHNTLNKPNVPVTPGTYISRDNSLFVASSSNFYVKSIEDMFSRFDVKVTANGTYYGDLARLLEITGAPTSFNDVVGSKYYDMFVASAKKSNIFVDMSYFEKMFCTNEKPVWGQKLVFPSKQGLVSTGYLSPAYPLVYPKNGPHYAIDYYSDSLVRGSGIGKSYGTTTYSSLGETLAVVYKNVFDVNGEFQTEVVMRYSHLSPKTSTTKEYISPFEKIATMGSSGTGAKRKKEDNAYINVVHVHFEMSTNADNPLATYTEGHKKYTKPNVSVMEDPLKYLFRYEGDTFNPDSVVDKSNEEYREIGGVRYEWFKVSDYKNMPILPKPQ